VTIEQHYTNHTETPVNTHFQFPLHKNAAVCGFEAVLDGTTVKGVVQEKQKAQEMHEEAQKEGKTSYLLTKSEEVDNVFEMTLGNLAPGKDVIVRTTYIAELDSNERNNAIRFSLPALIPGGGSIDATLDKIIFEPAKSFVPEDEPALEYSGTFNGIHLNLSVEIASNIKNIELFNGAKDCEFKYFVHNAKASIRVSNSSVVWFTQDLELDITLENPHDSRVWLEKSENNTYAAMLVANPREQDFKPSEEDIVLNEFVFMLDRSGSMNGDAMASARATLNKCLDMLSTACTFNIIGFGSHHEMLFPTSVIASTENIQFARQHVATVEADLGGTNLLDPLTDLSRQQVAKYVARQVFLLTDGCVENRSECVELVKKHSNTTRVFSFGIGGCDRTLIRDIASAGHGRSELVSTGNEHELVEVVAKQFNRANKPAYTNVSLKWGDNQIPLQSPFVLPPLFCDDKYIVYTIIPQDMISNPLEKQTMTLTASSANSTYTIDFDFIPANAQVGDAIVHRLAARSVISELEEGELRKRMSDDQADEKATRLALTYGLVCKTTSYIAIEETITVAHPEDAQDIHIPLPQFQASQVPQYDCGGCAGGGSGLGIFARNANMNLGTDMSVCNMDAYMTSTSTPFGLEATPVQVGNFVNMFKGPLADLEGRNCWLNALLPLLMMIKPLVDHLTERDFEQDSFAADLALLIKYWSHADQNNNSFRRHFEFLYNRVWYHLQTMGFTFGVNHNVIAVVQKIMNALQVPNVDFTNSSSVDSCTKDYVILFNTNDEQVTIEGTSKYNLKSAINYHVFSTPDVETGHYSCIAPTREGFYYYDDILNLGENFSEYKGGLVVGVAPEEFLSHVHVAVFSKVNVPEARTLFHGIEEQVETLMQQVALKEFQVQERVFYAKATIDLATSVTLLRAIRFTSLFETEKSVVVDESAVQSPRTKTESKLRHLAREELLKLSELPQTSRCLFMACKFGIFNALITLPATSSVITIELTEYLSSEGVGLLKLAQILKPFASVMYKARGKNSRKKKQQTVVSYILKNNFLASGEQAKAIMKFM
jgi:Ca-activated chloride channel family protein